ncbi:MAG: hypothetical protein SGI74_01435 [Oligoflexia bacterium]|nr:hypothetical protein [Oligoflexia bacterium]
MESKTELPCLFEMEGIFNLNIAMGASLKQFELKEIVRIMSLLMHATDHYVVLSFSITKKLDA